MRFVEAVARELLYDVEDVARLLRVDAVAHGPVDEFGALLLHYLFFLLSHRAAQKVRFAERVARELARALHDLLLVEDDAVGVLHVRLEPRVEIVDLFLAVLALDVGVDHSAFERPGAVERDERDHVLEAVGAKPPHERRHARRFELEYAERVAALEHVVGLRVVYRYFVEVDVPFAVALDVLHRAVEDGERAQAEEVHLDEA